MAIKSKARHDLTLRSIKREIGAGRDVAFWLDKAYTHYDNGLLDEADIAEVETLAQAYYDAVDARESADEVTETPDVPEVDGAENTTGEENDTNEKEKTRMSDSALAVYTAISPNCNRPRSQPISKITVHHMAGNTTLESFGALVGRPSRQMSANYAIESSGRIGLFCHEADRSWCSSSPWNDHRAVTIEVANDSGAPDWHVSDKAYAALLDLCTDICRRNGIKELTYTGDKNGSLTMHCFYAATACPGPYLKSKFPDIAAQVTKRLKGDVADAAPAKTQEQTFIDVMAEKCQSRCLNAHLLPSLCIAQACLESAYGTSELAVQANNLFGIKASNWSGRVYNKATKEWDGSKYITITAGFRAYDTMAACVEDYIKKLTTMPRYSNLVGCTDINKACEYIRADGWATSPTYTASLLAVVKQFNLTRYDAAIKEDKPAAQTHQEVWLDHVVLPNAAAMEFYLIAKKYGLDNDKAYHAKYVEV